VTTILLDTHAVHWWAAEPDRLSTAADRLIYATAVERGCRLVTKDGRMRRHRHPRTVTVW